MGKVLTLESIKARYPEGTKVVQLEYEGNVYFRSNDLNIEKAARAFKDLVLKEINKEKSTLKEM